MRFPDMEMSLKKIQNIMKNKIEPPEMKSPTSALEDKAAAIELRSEEVHEILSHPPHALVRYGITLICSVILILFIGSFFFKYPDVVQGEVVITTENPPVWLVAKSTGRIKELYCMDKQRVNKGDILLVIENPANTNDVRSLIAYLDQVHISDSMIYIPETMLSQSYELGEIQSAWSLFLKYSVNYKNSVSFNPSIQEKDNVLKQLNDKRKYVNNLKKQLDMKERDQKLASDIYEREKALYEKKVNSKYDIEVAEQTYIIKKQDILQLQTTIALAEMENTQLQGTINKLSIQQIQDKNQICSDLDGAYRQLKATVEAWLQNYVLTAPENGNITFNSFWKRNQNIKTSDKVFALVTENAGKIIGKIKLPVDGSGKVKMKQLVNLKISGYPYLEFGLLQGQIVNKSLVTNDNFYTVEVLLIKGLCTTTGKELNFTGELTGIAEIITENKSLIERIYSPMKYLLTKSVH